MELLPGESTSWHFHSEVTDHMVGLTGVIIVHLKQPEALFKLYPGLRCTVEVGRAHQVSNDSTGDPASYLLIQGIGRYDLNVVDFE